MAAPENWTVGRLLQWTTDYLKQHGAESPRLDAEVLLAAARGCKRIELYTSFDESASEELRTKFRELVRRRAEGMPVAYLVGKKEFYSLEFQVTPDVLIPRPETELLVMRLLDVIKGRDTGSLKGRQIDSPGDDRAAASTEVADVGTGSGIIAVCAAKQAGCHVTALEISPAALRVARQNAANLGVAERIEFVESDLFGSLVADRHFDLIATNPPYISTAEMNALPKDVRDYEPRLALAAGERGTEIIERLIPQAANRLLPGGVLLMEISPMVEQSARQLVEAEARLELGPTLKDLAGLPRVVQATRKQE